MLQIFGSLFMTVADYSKTVGHVYCKPFKGLRAGIEIDGEEMPTGTQPERGVVIDAAVAPPIRPGTETTREIHRIHIRLQAARLKGAQSDIMMAARELMQLLDRVTAESVRLSDPRTPRMRQGRRQLRCRAEHAQLFQQAGDVYNRLIGLFPNSASVHRQFCDYLIDAGRFDEARAELQRARELDSSDTRIQQLEIKLALRSGHVSDSMETGA